MFLSFEIVDEILATEGRWVFIGFHCIRKIYS